MGKDDMPGIIRPNRRRGETRWARFWRRRRMNAVRNSSDHAVVVAIGIFAGLALLGAVLFFGLRGARFQPGPGLRGAEVFKSPAR
jgi:hypothetical protein